MNELDYFNKFLFEAPGDPPDISDVGSDAPPEGDAPLDPPPDIGSDDIGTTDDAVPPPPDLSDIDAGGDYTDDNSDTNSEDSGDDNKKVKEIVGLDNKVSAIMNATLYQRFLSLLNTIGGQLSSVKNNSDIFYTISSDSLDIISNLEKLDGNIRIYLKNTFIDENYSKNLLFFNKCLNLLKLLDDVFEKAIKKGIRHKE